jgi:hypothetical protein
MNAIACRVCGVKRIEKFLPRQMVNAINAPTWGIPLDNTTAHSEDAINLHMVDGPSLSSQNLRKVASIDHHKHSKKNLLVSAFLRISYRKSWLLANIADINLQTRVLLLNYSVTYASLPFSNTRMQK